MILAKTSKLKEIFADALEEPPESRGSFLDLRCGPDTELREAIQDLLNSHAAMGAFLESEAPPAVQEGAILCGRYRIVRMIGQGGTGEVYEAMDEELSVFVALKIVISASDQTVSQSHFRREILSARQITHPNVCHVFDYHRDTGTPPDNHTREFISMERLSGETLAARLKDGPLSEPAAIDIIRQLCDGLEAAHDKGIIHRDLKPANIMLAPDEAAESAEKVRAVIMDFGLARETEAPADRTTTGLVFGTPAYISPEQLRSEPSTRATDIYALGIISYEMLSCTRPFGPDDDSHSGGAWRRLTDAPEPLRKKNPAVSPLLSGIVMKCLERDPKSRFQSAGELRAALNGKTNGRKLIPISLGASALILGAILLTWNRPIFQRSLPADKHVIILPFTGKAIIGSDAAFTDGIADVLSARLATFQQPGSRFWVVPFAEVHSLAIQDASRGRALAGANLNLAISLRQNGDALDCDLDLRDTRSRTLRHRHLRILRRDLALLETELLESSEAMLDLDRRAADVHDPDPDNARLPGAWEFYQEGMGYLDRFGPANAERAAEMFAMAIETDPKYAAAWAGLAQAHISRFSGTRDPQWLDRAETAAKQALALDPERAHVHLCLGQIDLSRGRPAMALVHFETAAKRDPSLGFALVLMARAHEALGNPLQAESLLQKAISTTPDYWHAYNNLGSLYFRNNQFEKAESLFRTVTQLAPENQLGYANLGGALLAQDKYAQARQALQKALELKPAAAAYSNLGSVLYREKKYGDSAAMFRKAVEMAPKDARMWHNLGEALAQNRQPAGAYDAYVECASAVAAEIERGVSDAHLLGTGAICDVKTGKAANARKAIAQALSLAPGDNDVLFKAALVYAGLGENASAFKALDKAYSAGYPRTAVLDAPELVHLRDDPRFRKWLPADNKND